MRSAHGLPDCTRVGHVGLVEADCGRRAVRPDAESGDRFVARRGCTTCSPAAAAPTCCGCRRLRGGATAQRADPARALWHEGRRGLSSVGRAAAAGDRRDSGARQPRPGRRGGPGLGCDAVAVTSGDATASPISAELAWSLEGHRRRAAGRPRTLRGRRTADAYPAAYGFPAGARGGAPLHWLAAGRQAATDLLLYLGRTAVWSPRVLPRSLWIKLQDGGPSSSARPGSAAAASLHVSSSGPWWSTPRTRKPDLMHHNEGKGVLSSSIRPSVTARPVLACLPPDGASAARQRAARDHVVWSGPGRTWPTRWPRCPARLAGVAGDPGSHRSVAGQRTFGAGGR